MASSQESGNRGGAAVSSGDFGLAGGRSGWSNCCRISEIFVELWEDLPYSLPFAFNFVDAFL